jgi:hypothetical protein
MTAWETITDIAPDGRYLLPGRPRLLGYIPQRFRTWGGEPSRPYANFFPQIERAVQEQLVSRLSEFGKDLVPPKGSSLKLGEIKDFASQAILSQVTGKAIPDDSFVEIAKRIVNRIKDWNGNQSAAK